MPDARKLKAPGDEQVQAYAGFVAFHPFRASWPFSYHFIFLLKPDSGILEGFFIEYFAACILAAQFKIPVPGKVLCL